jgi:hypothetical protein
MADSPTPPPFLVLLDKAAGEGIDLALIARGVADAQAEVSRQAALSLANGLYPVSFFAMLQRLELLAQAIAKARGVGVTIAAVGGVLEAARALDIAAGQAAPAARESGT